MDLALYASFIAVIALMWFLPGPDWAFVLSQASAGRPWRAGIVGIALGYLVMTAVVAGGLATLIALSPIALPIITVVGALYLIVLGSLAVRRMFIEHRSAVQPAVPLDLVGAAHPETGPITLPVAAEEGIPLALVAGGERRSALAAVAAGFGVSALNPKALIFFVALFPQFVSAASWPVAAQLTTLGLTWIAISSVLYVVLALTSRRVFERVPRAAGWVSGLAATSMLVMGTVLIAEQVVPLVAG